MAFLIVGRPSDPTCSALAAAARGLGLDSAAIEPRQLRDKARVGDVVLGRLGVRTSHDGVERGLDDLSRAVARGILVLNPPTGILAASDKLATALRLGRAGIPHPRTALIGGGTRPDAPLPAVLKPRFGSCGREVTVCVDAAALERRLAELARERWFRRHGAVLQSYVPAGEPLRALVAGGRAIAGLDGDAEAERLAVAAAVATDTDLVAVDLLRETSGALVVIDLDPAPALDSLELAAAAVEALFAGSCAALPVSA